MQLRESVRRFELQALWKSAMELAIALLDARRKSMVDTSLLLQTAER